MGDGGRGAPGSKGGPTSQCGDGSRTGMRRRNAQVCRLCARRGCQGGCTAALCAALVTAAATAAAVLACAAQLRCRATQPTRCRVRRLLWRVLCSTRGAAAWLTLLGLRWRRRPLPLGSGVGTSDAALAGLRWPLPLWRARRGSCAALAGPGWLGLRRPLLLWSGRCRSLATLRMPPSLARSLQSSTRTPNFLQVVRELLEMGCGGGARGEASQTSTHQQSPPPPKLSIPHRKRATHLASRHQWAALKAWNTRMS